MCTVHKYVAHFSFIQPSCLLTGTHEDNLKQIVTLIETLFPPGTSVICCMFSPCSRRIRTPSAAFQKKVVMLARFVLSVSETAESLNVFQTLEKESPRGILLFLSDKMLFVVPVSEFLHGSICSVQLEAASVKNRLIVYPLQS